MANVNEKLLVSVGAALRKHRTALRLSQDRFADELRMHRAYYAAVERGKKNVTLHTLWRLSQGLGVRISDVIRDAGY